MDTKAAPAKSKVTAAMEAKAGLRKSQVKALKAVKSTLMKPTRKARTVADVKAGLRKPLAKGFMDSKAALKKPKAKTGTTMDLKTGPRKAGVKSKDSTKGSVSTVAAAEAGSGGGKKKPQSQKEIARINKELDAAKRQYPSNLKELAGLVEKAAKRVVSELKWDVDPIVKKVANNSLDAGYKQYAKRYKRKWAGKPADKEYAHREVLFGKKLLLAIQAKEAFREKVLYMSGFFDYDKGEMFCSGHNHSRKPVSHE